MIHLYPCSCPAGKMMRVRRSVWMRALFPTRALYQCSSCGDRFLATVGQQAEVGQRAFSERQAPPRPAAEDGAPQSSGVA